jgi:hypothetical protein
MDLSAGLQNEEALQIPPELYMAGATLRDPEQQPPLALQGLLDQISSDYDSLLQRTRGGFNEAQAHAQAGGHSLQEANKAVGEYKELEDTLSRAQAAVAQLQNKLNEVRSSLPLQNRRKARRPSKLLALSQPRSSALLLFCSSALLLFCSSALLLFCSVIPPPIPRRTPLRSDRASTCCLGRMTSCGPPCQSCTCWKPCSPTRRRRSASRSC